MTDTVPAELVMAATAYDRANRGPVWAPVPDEQVERLLTGARGLLMETVARSLGTQLRIVTAKDLSRIVEVAAAYLDMCEPPPTEDLAALERLRVAAGGSDA